MKSPQSPYLTLSYWQKKYEALPVYMRNRFFLAGAYFSIWMGFFDKNSALALFFENAEIHELSSERHRLTEEMTAIQQQREALLNDRKKLEEYARETYFMKKNDESIIYLRDY